MTSSLRRLGHAVKARPRRSGIVVALLAVLLVGAVVTVVRSDPPSKDNGSSATGDRPGAAEAGAVTTAEQATGGPGASSTGGGTSSTGVDARREGATPLPGATPPTGASPPGSGVGPAGRPAGGEPSPVAPRPPVRCAATGAPAAGALPGPDERDGRRWVTVGRLAGNCDASSSPFRLQGIDTRLIWRSDADSFAVFVVDNVQGRDATAGFADGQCAGSCSESQPIVPSAGDYRLEVQAGNAPWEVEIQEYRGE